MKVAILGTRGIPATYGADPRLDRLLLVGVGVLALAPPAEAKIVYTPAHHVIGAGSTYQLIFRDTPEFTLSHGSGDNGRTYSFVELLPVRRGNGAVGTLLMPRPCTEDPG